MSNALLIINQKAHARELSGVAEFLLKGSGPRPVYFVEERMKPFGVHTKLATTSVQTLAADDFTISRSVKTLLTHAIAVEGAAMRKYCREAGIPDNQVIMTGTLVDGNPFEQPHLDPARG
jgi:hypothetical protein